MAAGMRNEVVAGTVAALDLHHRARQAAAIAQRREGAKLLAAQPVAKLRQEIRLELGDCQPQAFAKAQAETVKSDPLPEKIDQILRESEEGEGLREDSPATAEAAGAR